MNNSHVVPTVFARNKKEFDLRFKEMLKVADHIQIDFMDGKFVKSRSVKINEVPNLTKIKKYFEAHLMVSSPDEWIDDLKKKGFEKVIFHYEALEDIHKVRELVYKIKQMHMKAFVAFNPTTTFNVVFNTVSEVGDLDGILLMGHMPGKEHLMLHANTTRRIKNIKAVKENITVQIDGGVSDKTVKSLVKAGADIVNTGGYVADADDPRKALKELEKAFRKKN